MQSMKHRSPLFAWKRCRAVATAATVVVALAALTVWLLAPLSTHPASTLYEGTAFGRIPLADADVRLNAWILAWGSHAIAERNLAGFFDANIFWPARNALAYSEHMIGVLPLFAPIYLATGKLALSLNVWTMATFVLSGAAMYWVVLRTLASHPAAAVAAVFYAFAPWRFCQLMHVQVLSVQYLPLLAYFAWQGVKRPSVGRAVLLLVLLALQALSSYYLAYVAFLVVGVAAMGAVLSQGIGVRAGNLRGLAYTLAAPAAVALLLYLVSGPYLQLESAGVLAQESRILDPWGSIVWFLVPGTGAVATTTRLAWLIPFVLSVAGVVTGLRHSQWRSYTIVTIVLVVSATAFAAGPAASIAGFDAGYPFRLAGALVPGWLSLRVHFRFMIAVWLGVSFLAALCVARFSSRPAFATALAAACMIPYVAATASVVLPVVPALESDPGIVAASRWLAAHGEGDPVMELPIQVPPLEARYAYLSTLHWSPLVNGYSGYRPPSYALMASLANALPDRQALATLIRLDVVRWIVVHLDKHWLESEAWSVLGAGAVRYREGDTMVLELPYGRGDERPVLRPERSGLTLLGTSTRPLAEDDLRGQVVVRAREQTVDAEFPQVPVRMLVTNMSSTPWPAVGVEIDGLVGIEFSERLTGGTSLQPIRDFVRLPTDVDPGATVVLTAIFAIDSTRTEHEVVPCIVQVGTPSRRCFPDASVKVLVR